MKSIIKYLIKLAFKTIYVLHLIMRISNFRDQTGMIIGIRD